MQNYNEQEELDDVANELVRKAELALAEEKQDFTVVFYNPNIHPVKEYLIRKEENIRFAEKHNIPFIDCDYDTDNWFERAKGMENEPGKAIMQIQGSIKIK